MSSQPTDIPSAAPDIPDHRTHAVLNQPGDLVNYNAYTGDQALVEAVRAYGGNWARDRLDRAGALVGSEHVQQLARSANRYEPELHTHDRFGNRTDTIEFHPAYHELMELIFSCETHSLAWTHPQPGAHVARAALSYLWNQGENGICCPMGMTFASVAALRHDPALAAEWEPLIMRPGYDARPIHAREKSAITVGMAMTEKQGGSDLRQTQTTARPLGAARGSGAEYLITGHKWFFSVPMSDLFLTLAQTEGGVSCFLVPGWLPDGRRNNLRIQRLKDKCGNRSNASSEVEFQDLYGVMVGEEGRGIRNSIEMAHLTRLDFAVGSSGLMRQALSQALHHAGNRTSFGKPIIEQPIMANVAADLAVESEAFLWLSMRLASTLDHQDNDEHERLLSRIATPMAKYWACKQAPAFVVEALECHGGNGFIENHLMARLYREAPLNGIWEGVGNVICLDVVRAIEREPECVDAAMAEIRLGTGDDRILSDRADELEDRLRRLPDHPGEARRTVELLAYVLQASLLRRHAPEAVADAFITSRLGGDWGRGFGTLPEHADTGTIIRRATLRT
ncbi:acyl-CoA dehydrogenase family protein [Aquisalimonas sp.]|uniref:acyl-CoA dehydrogenase family protein n=1 Tax=unclassified Aquisalimonas TaxID=2644645 RepID=UPI0025C400A2|nr:acyl-CoA dehydrogenase family protein [Aquisalimonas sp.]